MWLNGFSLNIDGVALCKMLVLNQTEQGLRHLLGCAILLSLCCGACLRLGRSATFDLCPKESEASPCLLFLPFPSPRSKNFHYKGLLSATFCSLLVGLIPHPQPSSRLSPQPGPTLCFCPTAPLNPSCWPSKNAIPFKYQLTSDRT